MLKHFVSAAVLGLTAVTTIAHADHNPPGPQTFPVAKFAADEKGNTDDTSAVNSTIESACATGGGEVVFGNGATSIEGTIKIPCDGISLVGQGRRTSFINCRNGAADCISFSQEKQIYDAHIRHVYIQGLSKTGGNLINAT